MTDKQVAEYWLKFLADRFRQKIQTSDYYLSYSGGKDSHFLLWFIKEYLGNTDIEIVGANTGFEIPEIRRRITQNSDVVVHPIMHRDKVKEQYGIPCFSKLQDEYIHRYQTGNRSENTMKAINGENVMFNLNRKARELLLSGKLHKVSNKCCEYMKKRPMKQYEKRSGRKPIIGVRGSESGLRKSQYETCVQSNGSFTPIYDMSDDLMEMIYDLWQIPIPSCYQYLSRTGCAGCPYGRNTETELSLLPDIQRKSITGYFKESYDVLGVDYRNIQMTLSL